MNHWYKWAKVSAKLKEYFLKISKIIFYSKTLSIYYKITIKDGSKNMFKHIEVLTLRAFFLAKGEGKLPPYLGSTLRGILGHCIRDFVCSTPKVRCYQCNLRNGCAYAQCFCSPGNEAGAVNPYVLHALVQDKLEWKKGDVCTFDITLIGKITERVGLFLDALQAMGERGWGVSRISFSLEQVVDPIRNTLIFSGGKTWMRNMKPYLLDCEECPAGSILVRFDTPVRILVKRNLCQTLSFDSLVQSMSRRISLLSQAYTGRTVQWDEDNMIKAAKKIKTVQENWRFVDFKRYSMNHNGNKLNLPAIEGWALYEGDLTPFTPLLEAGCRLHVGKNSTIGFGHFSVMYDR
ncbi:MAG: CRISPR system precrRNA processing endoribonuclease RAMP protein Cas6 [Clostridia bacterium]|nr:CRISPR system precrRNA processing endoribonuclease RAMP protein Cas6 [Clostridia bacterium]